MSENSLEFSDMLFLFWRIDDLKQSHLSCNIINDLLLINNIIGQYRVILSCFGCFLSFSFCGFSGAFIYCSFGILVCFFGIYFFAVAATIIPIGLFFLHWCEAQRLQFIDG